MATVLHSAPRFTLIDGLKDTLSGALGEMLVEAKEEHGELLLSVQRDRLEDALRLLRDDHGYQQLMEIAGVDYPGRPERFEVVYMLLSLTKNSRIMVKVTASETTPVPTATTLWPNAGWLEREVFDLYGVVFAGNMDLRRILTDYGFEGHPFRKDFPLTGYVEMWYSEEDKRVVYKPVKLAQDFRSFDFMSPWEGAQYVLPGDEKAGQAPGAPTPAPAPPPPPAAPKGDAKGDTPKTTEKTSDTGAGAPADAKAADKSPDAPVKPEHHTDEGKGAAKPEDKA